MLSKTLLRNSQEAPNPLGIGNTVLLLHMENSIGLVDSSIYNSQVVTPSGSDAQITTNEKKFGNSSLWAGNDRGIYVSHNAQNQLYDHDFTIEGFFWLSDTSKTYGHRIIGTYDSPMLPTTDSKFLVAANSTLHGYGLILFVTDAYRNEIFSIQYKSSLLESHRWYHFAVVRAGNTFSLYLDGNLIGQNTPTQDIHFSANRIWIASGETFGEFSGYLDEIRIKKSVVYTNNFVVPTAPFNTLGET